MTTLKFILALLTLSCFTSCRGTYRLSEEDDTWMPYKGNEILVFQSNKGDTDTIFFLKKDTLIAYPEAQAINGKTHEVVSIFCRHSDSSPLDSNHRYLENNFVSLEKSIDKTIRLNFSLYAKEAKFYQLSGIKVDSLTKRPLTSLITKSKTYSDVYLIEGEDWMNFKQRSNYVTKLYWSKFRRTTSL